VHAVLRRHLPQGATLEDYAFEEGPSNLGAGRYPDPNGSHERVAPRRINVYEIFTALAASGNFSLLACERKLYTILASNCRAN
jgi:hypothetical protein